MKDDGPELLVLAVILAVLLFCMSGCVERGIVRHDSRQSIVRIHKHAWDKDTGKCLICGATYSPMRTASTQARLKDSKQIFINALMIESGLSEPDATILWEKYLLAKPNMKPNRKGFANYLIVTNPFQKIDRVYIDFVERIKVRTKILKRGAYVNK
jgi:hypothetical protein